MKNKNCPTTTDENRIPRRFQAKLFCNNSISAIDAAKVWQISNWWKIELRNLFANLLCLVTFGSDLRFPRDLDELKFKTIILILLIVFSFQWKLEWHSILHIHWFSVDCPKSNHANYYFNYCTKNLLRRHLECNGNYVCIVQYQIEYHTVEIKLCGMWIAFTMQHEALEVRKKSGRKREKRARALCIALHFIVSIDGFFPYNSVYCSTFCV